MANQPAQIQAHALQMLHRRNQSLKDIVHTLRIYQDNVGESEIQNDDIPSQKQILGSLIQALDPWNPSTFRDRIYMIDNVHACSMEVIGVTRPRRKKRAYSMHLSSSGVQLEIAIRVQPFCAAEQTVNPPKAPDRLRIDTYLLLY